MSRRKKSILEYDSEFLRENLRIVEENIINCFRKTVKEELAPMIIFRKSYSELGIIKISERELDRLLDKLSPLKYPRLYVCLLKAKYGVKELEYDVHRKMERFLDAIGLGWISRIFSKISITTTIHRQEKRFLVKINAHKAIPTYLIKKYQEILAQDPGEKTSIPENVFQRLLKSYFVSSLQATILYFFVLGVGLDYVEYKYSFKNMVLRSGIIRDNSRSLDSINKHLRNTVYTVIPSIIDPYIILGVMGCRMHYFGKVSYRIEGFNNTDSLVEMGGGVFRNERKCPIRASIVKDFSTNKILLRLQTPLSLNPFLALAPREVIEHVIDVEEICDGRSPPQNWYYKPSTIYRFYDGTLDAVRDSLKYAEVFKNIRKIYSKHTNIESAKKNIISSPLYPVLTYLLDCDIVVTEYLLFGKRYYKPKTPEGLLKSFVKALEHYFLGRCHHYRCYYSENTDNLTLAMRLLVNYVKRIIPLRAVLFEERVPEILLLPLRHGPRYVLRRLVDESEPDILDYSIVLYGQRIPVTREFIQYIVRLNKLSTLF